MKNDFGSVRFAFEVKHDLYLYSRHPVHLLLLLPVHPGIVFHEIMDSENALDVHINNCFEHYAKMMPLCHMVEARAACDASKVEHMRPLMTAWCPDGAHVSARM